MLVNISSLGSSRKLILSQTIVQFSLSHRRSKLSCVDSEATALIVIGVWTAAFLALGAWRMRTMDT